MGLTNGMRRPEAFSLGIAIGTSCLKGRLMSRKEAITILGRLFAIYLFVWIVVDFSYLLEYLFSAWHYLIESSSAASRDYWAGYYRVRTGLCALRILGFLAAARFFWTGGPKLEKLLWPLPADSGDSY